MNVTMNEVAAYRQTQATIDDFHQTVPVSAAATVEATSYNSSNVSGYISCINDDDDDDDNTKSSNHSNIYAAAPAAAVITPSRKHYCYELEAALALNNMALVMIQNGCISQACETLQSAVVAIRSVDDNGDDGSSSSRCNLYGRVKVAAECVLNPAPTCSTTAVSSLNCRFVSSHWETSLPSSQTIHLQSNNNSNNSMIDTLLMMRILNQQHQPSFNQENPLPCHTFIRIDDDTNGNDNDYDHKSDCNSRNLCHSNRLVCAMILYNFAVASFIYFNNDCNVDWCQEYENKRVERKLEAVGLLSHALENLKQSDPSSSSSSSSSFFNSRVFFVRATVYHMLQLMMEALDQGERAVACLEQLVHTRTLFSIWNDHNNRNYHYNTSPADHKPLAAAA